MSQHSFRCPMHGLPLYLASYCLPMCRVEKKELPHVRGPTHHRHHHKMTILPLPYSCIITTEMVLRPLFSAFMLAIFVKLVMMSKSCISAKRDVFTKKKISFENPDLSLMEHSKLLLILQLIN